MYSYEISQYLEARNYYFESFYEFENSLRSKSPQVRYDIIDEKPDCKVIHMWSSDGYELTIYIKKQTVF